MKKNNKKWIVVFTAIVLVAFGVLGCGNSDESTTESVETTAQEVAVVTKITGEEAQKMMASGDAYVLVDVRTQEEFDEGHIDGALLLPNDEIETLAPEQLTDKDALILVYCRSGNRSAKAASLLVSLGYSQVYDFGGIIDWPGEIVK